MIHATNNYVFIIRDEIKQEASGLLIPGQGQEKPFHGLIFSVGELVKDKKIKKGKKAIFMKGNGQEIEYNGETYIVLNDDRIIGVDEVGK